MSLALSDISLIVATVAIVMATSAGLILLGRRISELTEIRVKKERSYRDQIQELKNNLVRIDQEITVKDQMLEKCHSELAERERDLATARKTLEEFSKRKEEEKQQIESIRNDILQARDIMKQFQKEYIKILDVEKAITQKESSKKDA